MIQDILSCELGEFTIPAIDEAETVITTFIPPNNIFKTASGLVKYLRPNDNCIIQSFSVRLPFAFISANVPWAIQFYGYTAAGVLWNPEGVGADESFFVHSENVEIEKNLFIDYKNNITGIKTTFVGYLPAGKICCLNAPALLKGNTYKITAQIKLVHTLPLVA